ncbi:hypothetical protein ACMBCM_06475, partial [Spiroplasma sp. K1]
MFDIQLHAVEFYIYSFFFWFFVLIVFIYLFIYLFIFSFLSELSLEQLQVDLFEKQICGISKVSILQYSIVLFLC